MNEEIIKMMPDYHCYPLWRIGKSTVENISPEELPVSMSLKNLLMAWQTKYDSTLDRIDPAKSGFKNSDEEETFDKEGREIWKQLKHELEGVFEVNYFSVKDETLYT